MSEETKTAETNVEEGAIGPGPEAPTEEQPIQTMEELNAKRQAETEAIMEEYDQLFDDLDKGGYFKHGYAPGEKIEMDGTLFNQFVNFVNKSMQVHYSVGESLNILQNTNEAMITRLSAMTIQLMKQHKENVDNGSTKTHEELDKIDAKVNVSEAEAKPRKKTKKKATGSK